VSEVRRDAGSHTADRAIWPDSLTLLRQDLAASTHWDTRRIHDLALEDGEARWSETPPSRSSSLRGLVRVRVLFPSGPRIILTCESEDKLGRTREGYSGARLAWAARQAHSPLT